MVWFDRGNANQGLMEGQMEGKDHEGKSKIWHAHRERARTRIKNRISVFKTAARIKIISCKQTNFKYGNDNPMRFPYWCPINSKLKCDGISWLALLL